MPDALFQSLSTSDRRFALVTAQDMSYQRAFLLEKDVWIVATLGVLFDAPFGNHLIFKGGTSLSKVWRAISRFSEDVDITYDIRAFAPDLVAGTGDEALPPTRSQQKRWTRAIRVRLAEWVRDEACPFVEGELARTGFEAETRADGDRLYVQYDPLFQRTGLMRPEVLVEFGARSTGEPRVPPCCLRRTGLSADWRFRQRAHCHLANGVLGKATAIQSNCRQRVAGRTPSRLARLHASNRSRYMRRGLADRCLPFGARHKAISSSRRCPWRRSTTRRPFGRAATGLQERHRVRRRLRKMLADGMLFDESEPFDALMERCAAIEARANTRQAGYGR